MGRNSENNNTDNGFRGYLVRVQTKQGRVYRHRNLRLVLDKSIHQGLSLQTQRLGRQATSGVLVDVGDIISPDTSGHNSLREGLPVVAWRSYAARDKDGKKSSSAAGGRGFGGRYPVIEETTLDEFVQLAHATKLPGETSTSRVGNVNVSVEDDEQVAKLYSLGILYDGPTTTNESTDVDELAAIDSTPTADATSPYQADSLETIRHEEPLYTVRHVVAKRKGKRVVGNSAAKSPLKTSKAKTSKAGTAETAETEDTVETGETVNDNVPLYALNGVWEDGEGQTIDGRALWSDLEEFEYVVLADDDLASLAGSWVELESVLGTDDGE
ncbi:hypothetical protein Sste5346_008178 [Sporothrix stenoceras]|uniref:Uncharacterized protein n=1 Tax=Sporothrix stenoceras TaxID=5173 RepID=A0ABR3YR88_9PEZI